MRLATPKGFRDFLPQDAVKRQIVLAKIKQVFEKFGFDPLETPTLEYAETLKGKYGEEEKLIYEFTTKGGDEVALRYDQTVPTARVAAQYQELPKPFKRYQIQSAYRGENTQKGRYREFLQCDADIIGLASPLADAEILALLLEVYKNLGLDIILAVNDRKLLEGVEPKYLSALDKLDKIGPDGVKKELIGKGLSQVESDELFERIIKSDESTDLKEIRKLFIQMGYPTEKMAFNPSIIRGLDYYTGMIVEVRLAGATSSLAGGGRYDKMIGLFSGNDMAATGFAIGFDRTIEAMQEAGSLDTKNTNAKVLVTVFNPELLDKSLETSSLLRKNGINTEVWLDPNSKFDKQLKYADSKGIPYVVIIGPDEAAKSTLTVKNLANRTQESLTSDQLIQKLS